MISTAREVGVTPVLRRNLGIIGLLLLGAGSVAAALWDREPAAPVQPIAFSHRVHAEEFQIPCLYCHTAATRSPVAGIPSVQKCMGCHQLTARTRPEVVKLKGYWDRREPIPWIRIHSLPRFVYFSHKRHVRRDVPCQACHGEVGKMDTVRRVTSLQMNWCVECHRQRQASLDCLTCHQ